MAIINQASNPDFGRHLKSKPLVNQTPFNHLNTQVLSPTQWESEIRTCLDLEWFQRVLDFKCDLKSGRPSIWNLDKRLQFCHKPFEIGTKTSKFQMVWFSNGLAIASKSLDFKCFRSLDCHCIQIPSEYAFYIQFCFDVIGCKEENDADAFGCSNRK